MMVREGQALCFGDDVNSDVLHPSRFYSLEAETQAAGVLANSGGSKNNQSIWVAGKHFGVGSSRESTIRGILEVGVQAVIARSVSRIFWRNALNAGLVTLEGPECLERILEGESLRLEVCASEARLISGEEIIPLTPLDSYWFEVLSAGGLLAYTHL